MSQTREIVDEFVSELQELSKTDEAQERVKEYLQQIQELGVERYSPNNQLLLQIQVENRDDIDTGSAKYFHGYKTWLNEKGRQVKSGANSFKINSPPIVKPECPECGKSPDWHNDNEDSCNQHKEDNPEEDWEKSEFGHTTVSVFELSQTKPITECEDKTLDDVDADEVWYPTDRDANGDVDGLIESLESILEEEEIVFVEDDYRIGNVRGTSQDGTITIAQDMNEASEVQVIVHEIAHELLHHDDDYPREQKEVEAEAVAFAVCSYFDIETKSAEYVASWDSEQVDTWKRISDIQNVATEIIQRIENKLNQE